jgi:hypothetical protein
VLSQHIGAVLLVTGVITASPVLQFFAPGPGLKLLFKVEPPEGAGGFFARHWGLVVFAFGALLVYAGFHPEVRTPLLVVAIAEKLGLVALVAANWKEPWAAGFKLSAAFDSLCCLLYGLYLLGLG